MLSSKLKSWVESHLTRKNKSSDHHHHHHQRKTGSGLSHSSGALGGSGSCVNKEADRITHPAASLVNLVPAVPLCSSSGRSNAGVVIRLQNDFAAAANAAAASGHSGQRHHPSWTQSPVMLAWNTKLARIQHQQPTMSLFDPPLSPTPPPSASSTIQQQQKPSPTGSDWTQSTQSFAADSGCGDTNEGTLSSAADFTAAESSDRINGTPSLSSPESAYSTGCSDGVSPISQDGGMFEPMIHHKQIAEPIWRRSLLDGGSGAASATAVDGSHSSTQSPARTRPAIRTNPWLPVRTSLTSTSDRASWMTDATPETLLSELSLPAAVKETDIVSSDDDVVMNGESLSSALEAADRQMDLLCDSLEQLMGEQDLRRSFRRSPPSPAPANAPPTSLVPAAKPPPLPSSAEVGRGDARWDADDQYSQLIRQTEEILLQLENDELLLAARKQQEEQSEQQPPAPPLQSCSAEVGRRNSFVSSGPVQQQQTQRRRLRKTRRRCSSRSSGRDVYSSSESSDCDYSGPRRMASSSASASAAADWRGHRQARRTSSRASTNSTTATSCGKVTPRFNKSGRVMTHTTQAPVRVDRWLVNSQRTSCAPDDWTTEHDRPPSPAPMDPHCHWPNRSAYRASSRSYRHHSTGSGESASLAGSCPSSPAIGYAPAYSRQQPQQQQQQQQQWRQSVNREQQRLESQIAFLRQQLKDVTDDYYYDRIGGTPSSSDSGSSGLRLK